MGNSTNLHLFSCPTRARDLLIGISSASLFVVTASLLFTLSGNIGGPKNIYNIYIYWIYLIYIYIN